VGSGYTRLAATGDPVNRMTELIRRLLDVSRP